jgi:ATP-binding cassette subfamily G (WHITE) protein 2
VDILAGLGALGVTILLSIHQPRPDIFRLLDRVLVMSSDGRVVYSGPSLDAEAHFESMRNVPRKPEAVNIADFMLDVVLSADDDDIDAMIEDFEKSDVRANGRNMTHTLRVRCEDGDGGGDDDDGGDDAAATPLTKYVASYPRQVRALLRRMVRNVRRHPFLILLHFVATGVASLGLGGVFFAAGKDTGGIQNRMGCLFFILLYLALMSLSSLPVWREDRLLFLRERASGAYGVNAYFTSVVLFDVLVLRVFPPMFFTVVTYPLVGLHGGSFLVYLARASWFTLVNVLANVASSALCMAIGIVTPSNAVANVCGLMAILSSVLSGGFLLNKQNVSGSSVSSSSSAAAAASHRSPANVFVKVLTKTSFVNYAYDALLVNEFLDAGTFRFTPKFTDAAGQNENAGVGVDVSGREVLQFFSFGDTRAAMRYDVCVLCAIAGAYLAAAFVLLKVSVRRSGAGRG